MPYHVKYESELCLLIAIAFSCRAHFVQLDHQSLSLVRVATTATQLALREVVTAQPARLVNTVQAWVTLNQLVFVMLVSIVEELHLLL